MSRKKYVTEFVNRSVKRAGYMQKDMFAEIVEEALMGLPEEFSRKLENVEVVVEDEPPEKVLQELGLGRGTLLGLYHGVPLKKKGIWAAPILPGRISIYRMPILSVSRTREETRQRIRDVVIHEIGHHFGLTDKDMAPLTNEPVPREKTRSHIKRRGIRRGKKQ